MEHRILNFDNYEFRCSMLGALMTEAKGGSNLSKYEDAVAELASIEEEKEAKITEVELKISSTPSEKHKLKAYQNLLDKKTSLLDKYNAKIESQKEKISELESDKDKPNLSETTISKLMEIYAYEKSEINRQLTNKYVKKGNMVEHIGVDMLCSLDDELYFKNEERRRNGWIQGECDIDDEEKDRTVDHKGSFDYLTFIKVLGKPMDKAYEAQGQGYMWLWERSKHMVFYTLQDTPEEIIVQEERALLYKMGASFEGTEDYINACAEIRRAHNFSWMPEEERIIKFPEFDFNPEWIEELKKRIIAWRQWLNDFAQEDHDRSYVNSGYFTPRQRVAKKSVEEVVTDTMLNALSDAKLSGSEIVPKELENNTSLTIDTEEVGLRSAAQVTEDIKAEKAASQSYDYNALAQKVANKEELDGGEEEHIAMMDDFEKEVFNDMVLNLTPKESEEDKCVKLIKDCTTEQELIDLYRSNETIRNLNSSSPSFKEKMTARRAELKSPPPAAAAPVAKKSVSIAPTPEPAPAPEAPKTSGGPEYSPKEDEKEVYAKLITCKTGAEVRDYWKEKKEFFDSPDHKDLRHFMTIFGQTLPKK